MCACVCVNTCSGCVTSDHISRSWYHFITNFHIVHVLFMLLRFICFSVKLIYKRKLINVNLRNKFSFQRNLSVFHILDFHILVIRQRVSFFSKNTISAGFCWLYYFAVSRCNVIKLPPRATLMRSIFNSTKPPHPEA